MRDKLEIFFISFNFSDLEIDLVFDVVRYLGYLPEDRGFLHLPQDAFSTKRNQYNAGIIMKYVSYVRKSSALVIMKDDIYFQDLNFVFGVSSPTAKISLVSFARLNPEFYGYHFDTDLYSSRIRKEIAHELGHLEGLLHCQNQSCVMSFSNSIFDVDRKGDKFCNICLKLLGKSYY